MTAPHPTSKKGAKKGKDKSSGSNEIAATVLINIGGDENMEGGIDWLHLYFRDTRYT